MKLQRFKKVKATVKLRRCWPVKPEAEQIDGMTHVFTVGEEIQEGDSSYYVGEFRMDAEREGWPEDAPIWIGSGDLVQIVDVHLR